MARVTVPAQLLRYGDLLVMSGRQVLSIRSEGAGSARRIVVLTEHPLGRFTHTWSATTPVIVER